MTNHEVLLFAGAPGAGKSSIAEYMVGINMPPGVRHLSIGNLKRSIAAGETHSAYAEQLQQVAHPDRKTGSTPSEAMTGIIEEFILASPASLTILDGFPRYPDRVTPFQKSMTKISAAVLALCIVEVDDALAIERLKGRPVREGQKLKDPKERLADHSLKVLPTLELLADFFPTYRLDGSLPLSQNAGYVIDIYDHHRSSA